MLNTCSCDWPVFCSSALVAAEHHASKVGGIQLGFWRWDSVTFGLGPLALERPALRAALVSGLVVLLQRSIEIIEREDASQILRHALSAAQALRRWANAGHVSDLSSLCQTANFESARAFNCNGACLTSSSSSASATPKLLSMLLKTKSGTAAHTECQANQTSFPDRWGAMTGKIWTTFCK